MSKTKVILHDLDRSYDAMIEGKCDRMLAADGKYAPCRAALAVGPSTRRNAR